MRPPIIIRLFPKNIKETSNEIAQEVVLKGFIKDLEEGNYEDLFVDTFLKSEYMVLFNDYIIHRLTKNEYKRKLYDLIQRVMVFKEIYYPITVNQVIAPVRDYIKLPYDERAEAMLKAFQIPYEIKEDYDSDLNDNFTHFIIDEEYAKFILSSMWCNIKFNDIEHYNNMSKMPF